MKTLRALMNIFVGVPIWILLSTSVSAEAQKKMELENYGGSEALQNRVKSAIVATENSGKWPTDLPSIEELMSRGSERVRWVTMAAVFSRAIETDISVSNRQHLVQHLTKSLNNPEILVSQAAERWLRTFRPADFNQEARKIILERFKKNKSKEMILLAGLTDLDFCADTTRPFMDELDEYMNQPIEDAGIHWYRSKAWAATLVAARKGDKTVIQRVLEAVESENVPHPRLTILLRDLEYVAQPEVVDYVHQYLKSEEVSPGERDLVSMPFAHLAANSLARMLEGFPMKDGKGFAPETLKNCREWMASQKEWKFRSR